MQLTTLATRFRLPFGSTHPNRPDAAACERVPRPLMVLRGVSQRETIRSRAARVIAVTAMAFGTNDR